MTDNAPKELADILGRLDSIALLNGELVATALVAWLRVRVGREAVDQLWDLMDWWDLADEDQGYNCLGGDA